ncbi:hypothetical protein JCM1840_007629 [Sporobolomyces johnsonii]
MLRRESKGTCYTCGESGHQIGHCPSKKKESKDKTPTLNSVRLLGEEDHSDTSTSESDTDGEGKTLSDEEDEPPELEPIGESQERASPDVSGGGLEDDQLKSPYPRSIRVPIGINGTDNLSATVDTGASHTFLHPNAVRVANVKVQRYIKPKTLKLGTKGSRVKINAYAFIDLHSRFAQQATATDAKSPLVLTTIVRHRKDTARLYGLDSSIIPSASSRPTLLDGL